MEDLNAKESFEKRHFFVGFLKTLFYAWCVVFAFTEPLHHYIDKVAEKNNIIETTILLRIILCLILGIIISLFYMLGERNKVRLILNNIRREITEVEKKSKLPFIRYLFKEHLTRTGWEIVSIKGQLDLKSYRGDDAYEKEVEKFLKPGNSQFVLALCGNKFKTDTDAGKTRNIEYFRKFYAFAENRHRKKKPTDALYVCRIFIEPKGGFQEPFSQIMREHDANQETGVISLTILAKNQNAIKIENEFYDSLSKGVGFLIFKTKEGFESLIHEGMDDGMSFIHLKNSGSLLHLLKMYEKLIKVTEEFNPENLNTANKEKFDAVNKLFNELKICYSI